MKEKQILDEMSSLVDRKLALKANINSYGGQIIRLKEKITDTEARLKELGKDWDELLYDLNKLSGVEGDGKEN